MSEPSGRRSWLAQLGPGLVTGAADDDPSGIGTYSQVGAQFGYQLAWTMVFIYPLLVSIQTICARIGAVTGQGIIGNLRRFYPPLVLRGAVLLLLIANIINLGADIGAMAESLRLLVPVPLLVGTFGFGVVCVGLEIGLSYARYAGVLKWITVSLLAYVGVVFAAHVPLGAALSGTFIPAMTLDRAHVTGLVAVLGTTISPYLFFWEAAQEVEELQRRQRPPLIRSTAANVELHRIGADNLIGMAYSQAIAIVIIIATAATLHAHGVQTIASAVQAAQALRPIAGDFAFALFAIGIIGIGLLGVPVLAGSSAYALSEAFGWTEGLDRSPREARWFYLAIVLATVAGFALNLIGIDPMKALYWAAVVNGVLAAPLIAVTLLIATNRKAMGDCVISPRLAIGGWLGAAVMAVAAVLFAVV